MCGIVGIVDFSGAPIAAGLLRRMIAAIRHRGPDEQGLCLGPGVGLGHARLSVIDLKGGRQPMANEDRSVWVTFNGEIYNYLELREELQVQGHRFATRSDTEVIVHAYEEYGEGCVERFNGQWAFAVWDNRRRRLLLSRDRMGIRPLYYSLVGRKLVFASEVKALLVHPEISTQIDVVGLGQLFTFWAPLPPRTVFRGIEELPPASQLVATSAGRRTVRYWELEYSEPGGPVRAEVWAEELRELLFDATRLRLRSDVPVGVYLSGGLDSSVTACVTKKCHNAPLRAFSVTFDDLQFDESPFQQLMARQLDADRHSVHCTPETVGSVFPQVVRHAERPLLRTAPGPMFLLSQLVHDQGYKVVLTGEGADELLGGYDLFKEVKVRRFCARGGDGSWRALLFKKLYPYMPNIQSQSPAYLAAFFRTRPDQLDDPFLSHRPRWDLTARLHRFFAADLRNELATCDFCEQLAGVLPPSFSRWTPLAKAQYLETTILLPGYILASQGDRMAMAHAVEGRFPFLDHRIAEFAARMPQRLKMKGLKEKYVLKLAAREFVPEPIIRRSKQPYRAPDAACFVDPGRGRFRFEYVEELLAPERIREDGIFCAATVEQLVRKARAGRIAGTRDNMALVGILSTQLLVDQFIRSRPEGGSPARYPATPDTRGEWIPEIIPQPST